jgi:hypothetical protein
MSRAAREEIVLGRSVGNEEIVAELDKVDPDAVQGLAERNVAGAKPALAAVGRATRLKLREEDLAA